MDYSNLCYRSLVVVRLGREGVVRGGKFFPLKFIVQRQDANTHCRLQYYANQNQSLDSSDRQIGRQAQLSNISTCKAIADIIRTCLGPRAMLKMLLDPMGGIVLTNDGHAILREIDVSHPAAKAMLELCRAQDEEVGDGTTGVVVLAGEVMGRAEAFLERGMHPLIIIKGFKEALQVGLKGMDRISKPINVESDQEMIDLLKASLGTKFAAQWTDLICNMALQAVRTVCITQSNGNGSTANSITEIDVKRYVRVERIPGGAIEDSRLIPGVILNKDVIHAGMRRRIENPRILLIDCPLEYKKGESQTNVEVKKEGEWSRYLELEEEQVKEMCDMIVAFKPDLLVAEKGVSGNHFICSYAVSFFRPCSTLFGTSKCVRIETRQKVRHEQDCKGHRGYHRVPP